MDTDPPQLSVSRVVDAPRALVFQAFTDPEQLATWWGPRGHTLVPGATEADVRPGGFQRWTEVSIDEPDGRTRLEIRQWLPEHLAGPSTQGWAEAFEKLDLRLAHLQGVTAGTES